MGAALLHVADGLLQGVGEGTQRLVGGAAQTLQYGGEMTGTETVTYLTPQGDGTGGTCVGDEAVGNALFLQRFANRAGDGETGFQALFESIERDQMRRGVL